MTLKSRFETVAVPVASAFALAFLAAFVTSVAGAGLPTTLDAWKPILVVAAVGGVLAGVNADLQYLRAHLATLVAGTVLAPIVQDLSVAEPLADALVAAIEKAVAARFSVPVPPALVAPAVTDLVPPAPSAPLASVTPAAPAAEKKVSS